MKVDQFFLKMTTRGEISLRDIAHQITFFQSLECFIFLKHLLLRTLETSPNYAISDFELRSRISSIKSRGRPAEIFTYLITRIL